MVQDSSMQGQEKCLKEELQPDIIPKLDSNQHLGSHVDAKVHGAPSG